MRTALCWCLLFLCVIAAPAFADTRVALIVANSAYENAPLDNPTVDAALVSQALTEIGFDVAVVENASLESFDAAVQNFAARSKGADLALFYYAGHGFAVSDRGVLSNYLMSVEADVTSTNERLLKRDGMPLDDIILEISAEAKTTLVFIDACRNDPRVSRASGGRGRGAVPVTINFNESIFLGMSTRPGDVAQDGAAGAGSPFARAFAANIRTAGERLDDVFTKIRLDVEEETDRDQRPDVMRYDLAAPVVLNPAEAPAQPAQLDMCRDAGQHWAAISTRANLALVKEHLHLFSSCAFATLARLELDELERKEAEAKATAEAQARSRAVDLLEPGALPDKWIGDQDAPVTIIEYASMTCPHCAHFYKTTLPELKTKYVDTGKVRFVLREFPFDPRAEAGFMLARCANDNYFDVVDALFRQQENWARSDNARAALLELAKHAGFSEKSFESCLTDQKLLEDVRAVMKRGQTEFEINSAPTFFINGQKHSGAMTITEMSSIIDPLL